MLSEVTEILSPGQIPRRLRDQHLPAVPRSRDPCRTVDVHAHVALVGSNRLTRVDSHSHPYRPLTQRALRVERSRGRVCRTGKGDEERVALGVDLDTIVGGERFSQDPAVLGEDVRIPVTELV